MAIEDFSWAQPLPRPGTTTVLEASAGTGKTYTIAGMVARFVAAGVPLGQILAVTFSRLATAELRDGIRARLVRSRLALEQAVAGEPVGNDEVDLVITRVAPDELRRRLAFFETAIGQIDASPILTLHAFASRMLAELGLLADHDRIAAAEVDLQPLIDEVIADTFLGHPAGQDLPWSSAQAIGKAAIEHRCEVIEPSDGSADAELAFANQVRREFARRKRALRVLDYDDMITRLADALTVSPTRQAAAQLLSDRFPVVLVDEFQDTDALQWHFLRAGFGGRSTMMLIGDPKQAIYRFRGGDIETYAAARESADLVQRLGTNHRSDAAVVAGIEYIFGPVDLGPPGAPIELTRVDVQHQRPRIRVAGRELDDQVQIRALITAEAIRADPARELIGNDLVDQVNFLLQEAELLDHDGWRKVSASDIVVLVNVKEIGRQIHQQLGAAGHSSVFTGATSVFSTRAAKDWLIVLEALENLDRWHLRRAMMTSLIGLTSAEIAQASGDQLVDLTALLTRSSRLLANQSVAAVFETLVAERHRYAELLATADGEASVTDLRHIAELLNRAQTSQRLTPAALIEYLRRRIDRATITEEERTRRLATDRPAIRVMTVHAAKGLQFPIVLLPQAADQFTPDRDQGKPMVGHLDGVRVLDVAAAGQRPGRWEAYRAEERAESLRQFYVACTRAQSLLICWWVNTPKSTTSSALHRLLANRNPPNRAPDPSYPACAGTELPQRRFVSQIAVDANQIPTPSRPETAPRSQPERLLDARRFEDHIDRAWQRTSYTGLTAALHDAASAQPIDPDTDEAELPADQLADEITADDPLGAASLAGPGDLASALAGLPGGTQFGSLVHAILEQVDPAAADLPAALTATTAPLLERFPLAGIDLGALVAGLSQTLTTPLGVLTDGRSLRELGAANRLAELDFELPLGSAGLRRRVADLAELFTDLLPADDPLHGYGAQLASSAAAPTTLAGFLTGSIDVVLQVPGPIPRYVVLDYKTNRVPTNSDEPLVARHYSPAAMTDAMRQAHYPLQALLYCAALHRYLGWRLPGYHPSDHLGGVGYLFVRGMVGPQNPVIGTMPSGVFTWQPPAELVVRAAELLAGGV